MSKHIQKLAIASRRLEVAQDADTEATAYHVDITLFQPMKVGDFWECEYEIHSLHARGQIYEGKATGLDALHALISALQSIGLRVYNSELSRQDKLMWIESGQGYGLIVPSEFINLYKGQDH